MSRFLSLLVRKIQSYKSEKKLLKIFNQWKNELLRLEPYHSAEKNILIIRLDDIGDYLLFRNCLTAYKSSDKWKGYSITLLGNEAWKDFFISYDSQTVDDTIWVNKKNYLDGEIYRINLWRQLRSEGFKMVICPSCTRPLLLDDLCMLATGTENRIGSENTFRHRSWNELSDSFYPNLFRPENPFIHEFYFNQFFSNWCCSANLSMHRPEMTINAKPLIDEKYILCFIGAATKSRRWPIDRWIEFIKIQAKENPEYKIAIAGGKAEAGMAGEITSATNSLNFAGIISLTEMAIMIKYSVAVVTNNTMAAHLSASFNIPTVIIANGDNYLRFTEYAKAGIENVITIYPEVFNKWRKRNGDRSLHYTAVTADIGSISAVEAASALKRALQDYSH